MATTERQALRLEALMEAYSEQGPFEYIDGQFVPVVPWVVRSSRIGARLFFLLTDFAVLSGTGEPFMKMPYVLMQTEDWVKGSRVPDLMFVTAGRMATMAAADPDWQDKPLLLVPDLAAEVVSPTDRFGAVTQKVARYLADGVRFVWVVEPQTESVWVHSPAGTVEHLSGEAAVLDGADVVPGFKLPLARLFHPDQQPPASP